jgi:hypothetical protein
MMKVVVIALLAVACAQVSQVTTPASRASPSGASTPAASPLDTALESIGLDTALVVISQAVDEHPVWATADDRIAVNIDGEWYQIDFTKMKLARGTWRGGRAIAVNQALDSVTPLSPKVVARWQLGERYGNRVVKTEAGDSVELREQELGTSLVVRRAGETEKVVWTSDLENCYSPTVSRDGRYFAFICELSGVIVSRLQP